MAEIFLSGSMASTLFENVILPDQIIAGCNLIIFNIFLSDIPEGKTSGATLAEQSEVNPIPLRVG